MSGRWGGRVGPNQGGAEIEIERHKGPIFCDRLGEDLGIGQSLQGLLAQVNGVVSCGSKLGARPSNLLLRAAMLSLRAECSKNGLCGVALLRLRAVFLRSRSRFGLPALVTDIIRTASQGVRSSRRGIRRRRHCLSRRGIMGRSTPPSRAAAIASGYPASAWRMTPVPGSAVSTRSRRRVAASVPSATTTMPAWIE